MLGVAGSVIHLSGVEIDVRAERVRRADTECRLRHKTFEVLLFLIENRNREVSKAEIFERVWGGVAVTEDTLVQSIVEIRKALGDDPHSPRFVRTIPRVGYRFIAPVEDVSPLAGFDVIHVRTVTPSGSHEFRALDLEESQSIELAVEEIEDDWRHFIPHITIAVVVVALATLAAFWMHEKRTAAGAEAIASPSAIVARGSHDADRMTDSLDAYEEYRLGLAATDGLRNTEALAHFQRAIDLDPQFAMAYARIGYTFAVRWSLLDRAKPYLVKALEAGDRLSEQERLYVLAWQAISNRDYGKAIDHFRLLVTRYPTDVEAFVGLGRLLVGEERLEEATDVLQRGLILDPDSPDLNNALGSVASYRGRHAEAIAHHKRYVAFDPKIPNAHDSLGLSYQWSGHYARALEEYSEALRLNPRFEVALVHRANTLWQIGRIRDAIREFQRYLEIGPSARERSRGYGELSRIYCNIGDMERATTFAREASQSDPDGIVFEIFLAADRGDAATARRLVQSMSSPRGSNRGARYSSRLQYMTQVAVARVERDEVRAIQYAREAVRRVPPLFLLDDFEDALGDNLAAFGRHPEAIAEYQRVLELNEHRARTRFKLARSLDAIGQRDEARAEYERFLTMWLHADADAPELVAAKVRLAEK